MKNTKGKAQTMMFYTLAAIQMLEHGLKLLISNRYQEISKVIKGKTYLNIEAKTKLDTYNNMNLKQLIDEISKVINNKELIKQLNDIRVKRNPIAHAGFMQLAQVSEEHVLEQTYSELIALQELVNNCMTQVVGYFAANKIKMDG